MSTRVVLRGEGSIVTYPSGQPPRQEQDGLAPDEPDAFRAFWTLFLEARKNPALAVVIRRFSYAAERTRAADQIIDLIATLEALLLSDVAERGELRFRTAPRGAPFHRRDRAYAAPGPKATPPRL